MEEAAAPLVGEISQDSPVERHAPGGGIVPASATTAGQFLDLLGDGQISADLHAQLRDLAAEMTDLNRATGQKQKGKIVLSLDFEFEDRAFKIATDVKVTKPKLKALRSIMFTDEHNRFTRFPPGQHQMFGVRQVGGGSGSPPRSV